ncbi:MAG: hypothetical protein H7343_10245 [Undibacterium sp.]|nr:hypothetical protein [Opitutaceae bacterium]
MKTAIYYLAAPFAFMALVMFGAAALLAGFFASAAWAALVRLCRIK